MNKTRLFSVVVPAYNTEKFIGRCLLSLCAQTLEPALYEVIVVNDGSPDSLEETVLELQKKYPVIEYIVQENKNLGGARNTGIRASSGRYVVFVDSDDYICFSNALEILAEIAETERPDFIWSKTHLDSDCGEPPTSRAYTDEVRSVIRSGGDIMRDTDFSYAAWQFVISREYIEKFDLFFREGVYYEDSDFTARLFYYAKRVSVTDFPFYVYCRNIASITGSPTPRAFADNCRSLIAVREFIDGHVREPDIRARLREKIKRSLLSYLRLSRRYSVGDSMAALSVIRGHDVMRLSDYSCSPFELLQLAALKYAPFFSFHFAKWISLPVRLARRLAVSLKLRSTGAI